MPAAPYVVVGAGQAGLQLCDCLRKLGYTGPLVLFGDEPYLPYQRPPLSKKFLTGEPEPERLLFRPASHYEKLGIDVRLGVRVARIERERHELVLDDGSAQPYAKLALCTGARIRPLDCPGSDDADLFYVRTLDDGLRLRARLAAARRVVVVGGGFIGLEVAAIARTLGLEVVLLEALERLMARAVSPQVSTHYAALHRAHGVDLRLGCGVRALERTGGTLQVHTADGEALAADLVVAGIGVVPNAELAAAAGLPCGNGIVVDGCAATCDPDIVAAGDCTLHYNGFVEREIRLESVQNAVDQARVAAASAIGQPEPYVKVPWFWSDQYDAKLQIAGLGLPCDEAVLRGDSGSGSFSWFYFRAGRLAGADSINRPLDHMACRRLLEQGTLLSSAQAADADVDLMAIARA